MSLSQQIEESYIRALKSKDNSSVSALRMLRSALKNKEIERRRKLEEPEILSVLQGLIRQGKEAKEQFEKGGRPDLAEKERVEMEIYSTFLPNQASLSDIEQVVDGIIFEIKPLGMKDMGKVMKEAMARLSGRAEGKTIQEVVKQKLSSL